MIEPVVKDIGTLLKDQREKLGYSLQDVEQQTRIRKSFLESIENNRFFDLPGQAYVTGFIKVYACFLGVDNNPLLKMIEEIQSDVVPSPVKPTAATRHHLQRLGKSSSRANLRVFVFGLLAVLFVGGAVLLLSPMSQENTPADVASNQVLLVKVPLLGSEKVKGDTTGEVNQADQVVAVPLSDAVPIPAVDEHTSPDQKSLPSVAPEGSSLRMLALSEGSLIIYLDDRKSHRYMLHDGLDLAWTVKKMVKIELAGPGMASFWLDNQELDLGGLESFKLQTLSGD